MQIEKCEIALIAKVDLRCNEKIEQVDNYSYRV